MRLRCISLRNYRRLKSIRIQLEPDATIFVGANNSGKTSAAHGLRTFLRPGREKFSIHDFNAACFAAFDAAGDAEAGTNVTLPVISLDLWFDVDAADLHRAIDLLPSLDWSGTPVGIRIEFAPRDVTALLTVYREARGKALAVEAERHFRDKVAPKSLTDFLAKTLNEHYALRYFVLDYLQFDERLIARPGYDPSPMGPNDRAGAKVVESLLRVDFLDAQRHLSDGDGQGRSEDLSRRLNRFYRQNLRKCEQDVAALQALSESELLLNRHFEAVFEPTLRSIGEFGYPGVTQPRLLIKSEMDPERALGHTARVHYELGAGHAGGSALTLPDRFNGLGFKNLIYMVVELLDFQARCLDDVDEPRPLLHLVIIEEPEAHLHVQLQQVFIRQILDVMRKNCGSEIGLTFQLVVTTHSPHLLYERGFSPIRYFHRCKATGIDQTSDVRNLSDFQGKVATDEAVRFLTKYMKLTHCDLFFADAAILVEGSVERLLMPAMVKLAAPKLESCYLSVLEVGGAFAHCFKDLLEFLSLPTLVITDLDSVAPEKAGAAGRPSRRMKACMAQEHDAVSSNPALKEWMPKIEEVSLLLTATSAQRTYVGADPSFKVRIAYQDRRPITWKSETGVVAGRTFEEAFAFENLAWCQDKGRSTGLQIKEGDSLDMLEMIRRIHKRVRSSSFSKTEFALGVMTDDGWVVPAYIAEGLRWLCEEIASARVAP